MSFRLKMILGMAVIQVAILTLLITYGISVLQNSNEAELVRRTQSTATLFASAVRPAVLAMDVAAVDSLTKDVLSNHGIVYARVIGPQGVLAEAGDPAALRRKFVADRDIKAARNAVFNTAADIVVAGQPYGRVEIGFSTAGIRQLVEQTRAETVMISAASIGLVAVFSALFGLYLTRGLNVLRKGTHLIAMGELGHQIPVRGRDELAATAADFNDMSRKLLALEVERKRKAEEVLQLNQDLERRVEERTQQLSRLNQQLEHQAMHDALTRLPNRALFSDRLRTTLLGARREDTRFAVICLDLDLFKEINDTLGHSAGDKVLQHVAEACNRTLRDSDTVARVGGDEFAAIMPYLSDEYDPTATAQRLLEAIRQPLALAGKWVQIDASLGVAVYPEHGSSEAELLHHSDAAMYCAKRNKRGVVLYRPELEESAEPEATRDPGRPALSRPTLDVDTRAPGPH